MTEEEKYRQIKREALATGGALAVIIVFWLAAGFGLAPLRVQVFHLPLWVVASCFGTWLLSVVLVRLLTKYVFRDMNLEEDSHE